MSRSHSHITSATAIISTYSTGKPLSIHIREFFAADKKYGSRDRRNIASLCYYYYRTGKAFKKNTVLEKILAGIFLCEQKSHELLRQFRPDLDDRVSLPFTEKFAVLEINGADIFPFTDELGEGIDQFLFTHSFLVQPRIYLRIRPGKKKAVTDKLASASLKFEWMNDSCLLLENNKQVDQILKVNKEVVVQDRNSQQVLNFLLNDHRFSTVIKKVTAWDCCAASGGKSILLFDLLKGNLQLTVSDIRDNILLNLTKRLAQAGVNINKSFVADLSKKTTLDTDDKFSIIVCDVPCTGSGTWSRSPEQLYYFDKKQVEVYSIRQQQILANTIPHLEQQGLFFYITCSVFKKENEENVTFIKEKFHLHLLQMEYIKGYENASDSMFVAVFTTPNLS